MMKQVNVRINTIATTVKTQTRDITDDLIVAQDVLDTVKNDSIIFDQIIKTLKTLANKKYTSEYSQSIQELRSIVEDGEINTDIRAALSIVLFSKYGQRIMRAPGLWADVVKKDDNEMLENYIANKILKNVYLHNNSDMNESYKYFDVIRNMVKSKYKSVNNMAVKLLDEAQKKRYSNIRQLAKRKNETIKEYVDMMGPRAVERPVKNFVDPPLAELISDDDWEVYGQAIDDCESIMQKKAFVKYAHLVKNAHKLIPIISKIAKNKRNKELQETAKKFIDKMKK